MLPNQASRSRIAVTYPAVASSAPIVRRRLDRFLDEIGFAAERKMAVLLSAGEALANVIQHAYDGFAVPGKMSLSAFVRGDELVVEVADRGEWRACRKAPEAPLLAENGRGIRLMHAFCDEADVKRTADGTRICLTFPRA